MSHLVKLFFASLFSASAAWLSLLLLSVMRIWQTLEGLAVDPSLGDNNPDIMGLLDETVRTMQGGSAVFLASGISGVILSEIFGTRTMLYYMAGAGSLAIVLAMSLTATGPQTVNVGSSVIAVAGFIGGAVFWLVSGRASHVR